MSETIKFCTVCEKPFTPKNIRQKTCLNPNCVSKNKTIANRKYQKKVYKALSPNYEYNKNEGLILPKPKKKRNQHSMTVEEWNSLPVSERWKLMTWEQIDAECLRLHISYDKAQTMLMQGTLPEDFGRKAENNG